MRILLLTPMPPDRSAASAIPPLLHAELVGLREAHDVTLVTVAGPDPAEIAAVDRLRQDGVDVHAMVRALVRGTLGWRRRLRIVRSWLAGRAPLRTVWFAEPEVQAIVDGLAGAGFDVALVEDNAMGAFRLPPGLPVVLTEYEVRRPRPLRGPPAAPRGWLRWAFTEADWHRWPRYQRRVWSRCDALQVFTERDAAAVAELAPELSDRVRVNPFAIELPLLDAHVGDNEDTMLFAGNYTHPPNVDAALWLAEEIVPRVVALRPGAKLLLAGPYAPPAVRALNGPAVRFLGQVDDLDPLLRRAAVVMAPVRTGGGMRMKVLHALAHGKAVVTTPRGAEGLIGAGDPPLAVAHDAQGLADAAARLLADPASRRELGARARAYAQEFHSPQAHRARLEAAIADAVGRVRSGP